MGRLIKLIIVALVLFGSWNAVSAQWNHYKFEDVVKHIADFGVGKDEETVRAEVMKEAASVDLQLDPKTVVVQKTPERVHIEVAYTVPVLLAPGYRYNWAFSVVADGWFIPGTRTR